MNKEDKQISYAIQNGKQNEVLVYDVSGLLITSICYGGELINITNTTNTVTLTINEKNCIGVYVYNAKGYLIDNRSYPVSFKNDVNANTNMTNTNTTNTNTNINYKPYNNSLENNNTNSSTISYNNGNTSYDFSKHLTLWDKICSFIVGILVFIFIFKLYIYYNFTLCTGTIVAYILTFFTYKYVKNKNNLMKFVYLNMFWFPFAFSYIDFLVIKYFNINLFELFSNIINKINF